MHVLTSTFKCIRIKMSTQQDQRGPIGSQLNEHGHNGRVLAPIIGRYGGASSDLGLILDLVARELARKHTAF